MFLLSCTGSSCPASSCTQGGTHGRCVVVLGVVVRCVVCAASMCAASSVVVSAGSPCALSSCTGGGMHGRCVVVLGSCSGSSRAAPSLVVCCVVVCCVIGRCARGVFVPWVVVGVGGRTLGHRVHGVVRMDAEPSCGASPFASSCTGSPFAASCAGSSFAGSSCARGGTRWVLVRGVVAREGSWGGSDDGRNAYASLTNAHAKIGGRGVAWMARGETELRTRGPRRTPDPFLRPPPAPLLWGRHVYRGLHSNP
jgi:hypothetical protein